MHIYLLLGSNLGERIQYIHAARQTVAHRLGIIITQSKVYESAPWGGIAQANYLNQVLKIRSRVSATQLLGTCLDIEKHLGRIRIQKYSARSIDIDILYYGRQRILLKDLEVPHPAIAQRRFTLLPLVEISPKFRHPVLKCTHETLLERCEDPLDAWPYQPKV